MFTVLRVKSTKLTTFYIISRPTTLLYPFLMSYVSLQTNQSKRGLNDLMEFEAHPFLMMSHTFDLWFHIQYFIRKVFPVVEVWRRDCQYGFIKKWNHELVYTFLWYSIQVFFLFLFYIKYQAFLLLILSWVPTMFVFYIFFQ